MRSSDDRLAQVVQAVRASGRYRQIGVELIAHIGAQELAKRRSTKEAIKATKNKLHQVAGAYVEQVPDYATWLGELEAARQAEGSPGLARVCARIMSHHVSTQERLPILEQFYRVSLARIAPVRRVIDVACGLNPLAVPWMPLAPGATYFAYDVYEEMVAFVDRFLALAGVGGRAEVRDVTRSVPAQQADLALVLKAIPCLEQLDKPALREMLLTLNVPHLLVSFPVRSLGGRGKGMPAHYDASFRQLVAETGWAIERFDFATELAYLVSK